MNPAALTTVIRNNGPTRYFAFLPDGGRVLAEDEEYVYFGDLRRSIGEKAGTESSVRQRDIDAFNRAIESGALTILSTPSAVVEDSVTGDTYMVTVANGVVTLVDPYAVESSESESASESESVSESVSTPP